MPSSTRLVSTLLLFLLAIFPCGVHSSIPSIVYLTWEKCDSRELCKNATQRIPLNGHADFNDRPLANIWLTGLRLAPGKTDIQITEITCTITSSGSFLTIAYGAPAFSPNPNSTQAVVQEVACAYRGAQASSVAARTSTTATARSSMTSAATPATTSAAAAPKVSHDAAAQFASARMNSEIGLLAFGAVGLAIGYIF